MYHTPHYSRLGSIFQDLADLYATPGNVVREEEERAVYEAYGVTPDDPNWAVYRDAVNIDKGRTPVAGGPRGDPADPASYPHISQAPAALQIDEVAAQMSRYHGGGWAGLAMPCPGWASASVCGAARILYRNRLDGTDPSDGGDPPRWTGEGTGTDEDQEARGRTAPTVNLGLEYETGGGVNVPVLAGLGLLLVALALPTK